MTQPIQTLKGFRDILPEETRKRQWLKNIMINSCESWGFDPIETPTLEPLELFVGEIGEDEKLFFKFTDQGGRNVALRYDQTVPTCRFIGNNESKLIFPFKRYQIQNSFRAEKPQKGRYREFTQVDVDIYGITSPVADAEVIAQNLQTLKDIGFTQAKAVINSRDLMKNIPYEAIVAVDKLKKIGKDGVIEDMVSKGISVEKAKEYFTYIQNIKPDEAIEMIIKYLKDYGFTDDWYQFEPTLARSFSYSQGPIWELVIPEYTVGSVGGGERYDGMMKRLTGRDIPATGVAFGFDRTLEAADQLGLIPEVNKPVNILVSVFDISTFDYSIKTMKALRDNSIKTMIYPDIQTKLGKQFKYANQKGIPYVMVIGPDEASKGVVTLKNMATGEQQTDTLENLIPTLS
jgi:histidyl-tRNA synthetase